jgi:ribosomal protein L37E
LNLTVYEECIMARCSRCGKSMGSAQVCPHCGYGPSKSVMSRTVGKAANLTGRALEKGVKVTEEVAREVRPAVKTAVRYGKKGVSRAKEETLKAAKTLKEEGS